MANKLEDICDLINCKTENINILEDLIGLKNENHMLNESYTMFKMSVFNKNPLAEDYDIMIHQDVILDYLGIVYNYYNK